MVKISVVDDEPRVSVGIIQLSEQDADGQKMQARSQTYLIGQKIHMNLKQYLNVDMTVGMSSLYEDVFIKIHAGFSDFCKFGMNASQAMPELPLFACSFLLKYSIIWMEAANLSS